MPLKLSDKLKLASVAALLLIALTGVLLLYRQWPTDSQTAAIPTTLPDIALSTPSAPSLNADARRLLRLVQSDDTEQAAVMLAKNPSLAKANIAGSGITPLHMAHSVAMAKLLLDNGADINARDTRHSATPLRYVAARLSGRKQSILDLIRFLQSKGASASDIYLASAVGDVTQLEKILAANPSLIDKPSSENDVLFHACAPLQIAAYVGQFDSAKLLLEHGANVHNQGSWSNTEPLEKAAWTGSADVVELLLDHGAKIDGTDKDFTHSPLYNAATMGHADVVKILLTHGADTSPRLIPDVRNAMNQPDQGGPTPGTHEEFQQVLAMLNATPLTQTPAR